MFKSLTILRTEEQADGENEMFESRDDGSRLHFNGRSTNSDVYQAQYSFSVDDGEIA